MYECALRAKSKKMTSTRFQLSSAHTHKIINFNARKLGYRKYIIIRDSILVPMRLSWVTENILAHPFPKRLLFLGMRLNHNIKNIQNVLFSTR